MNEQTYTDRFPSGIEFEVRRMKGLHQEWLTKGRSGKSSAKAAGDKNLKNIDDVFADCCVRIGSDTNIDLKKVQDLTSPDFKYGLLVLRFFSCDEYFPERESEWREYQERKNEAKKEWEELKAAGTVDEAAEFEFEEFKSALPDHEFAFKYEWKGADDKMHTHDYSPALTLRDFEIKPFDKQFKELAEMAEYKVRAMTLKMSGKNIQWRMMDVKAENRYRTLAKAENIHANTFIEWRDPKELINNPKADAAQKVIPINLNLQKLDIPDIEQLRKDIYQSEAKVNTMLVLEHPDNSEDVRVDVTTVVSFFFPSGVV